MLNNAGITVQELINCRKSIKTVHGNRSVSSCETDTGRGF